MHVFRITSALVVLAFAGAAAAPEVVWATIRAAGAPLAFEGETAAGIPDDFLRFQGLEHESDYAENWLFV
ncbi:MAG: hypothetical protein M1457_12355, partial [bacterium]|nr:hypothetical protein [bacterium]